jgi:hypothetical protein
MDLQAFIANIARAYMVSATAEFGKVQSYADVGNYRLASLWTEKGDARIELTNLAALERELRKVAPDLFTKFKRDARKIGIPARNEIRDAFSRVGPGGPFGPRKVNPQKPWATQKRISGRTYDGWNTEGRLSWFNNYFSINSNSSIDVNYKNRKASQDFSKLRNGENATLSVVRVRVRKAPLIIIDMAGRKRTAMYSNGKYRTEPYSINLFGRGMVTRTHRINAQNSNDFVDRLRNAKQKLNSKASRYAYPALEKHSPKFVSQASQLINEVVAETNRRLRA